MSRTVTMLVYEFAFRTVGQTDVLATLYAQQDAGFELVSASGQPGRRVLMLFRRPKVIASVVHTPLAAARASKPAEA